MEHRSRDLLEGKVEALVAASARRMHSADVEGHKGWDRHMAGFDTGSETDVDAVVHQHKQWVRLDKRYIPAARTGTDSSRTSTRDSLLRWHGTRDEFF